MKLFGTMCIKENELNIGGIGVSELKSKHGTPLYIVDQKGFEDRANLFISNFKSNIFDAKVIYASKAFMNLSIAKLVSKLGLYIDVVSGGELYTALKAGFDPNKIYFHGNNKLYDEIFMAVQNGVGTFVVDNEYEYEMLCGISSECETVARVILRVNPGIEAHTHEYIQTTKNDSKFGLSIFDEKTMDFIIKMSSDPNIDFAGIHCHVGSQVFDEDTFFKEADAMIEYAKDIEDAAQLRIKEINLGGGFGVYYTNDDNPFELGSFLKRYIEHIESKLSELKLSPESISIEPGRSLINSYGSTLYTVGAVKKTMAGLPYVFVDGGMTDNPRPSLYQAKYEAVIANRMDAHNLDSYRIAGKCCETGDILIKDASLAEPKPGDLLLVSSTGAYNYSMSSNYNRIPRPEVVFVKDGVSKTAVKRETYEDLIRNDEVIDWVEL